MLGNKLILSAATALAVTLSSPAFAQRLTGCLDAKGNISQVQESDVPLSACGSNQTQIGWDQGATQGMIVVDSSVPAKVLGPVLDLSLSDVMVSLEFEGETYQIRVLFTRPSHPIFETDNRYFSDSNCSGQEYGHILNYVMLPNKQSFIIRTIAGHSLWVASGDPADLTVNSYLQPFPPYECVQATTPLQGLIPIRNTGINFDVDFTVPFRLANLPTVQ